MSTESFPSSAFTFIKTVKPPGLKPKFFYNFYVPDERVDDSGVFRGKAQSDEHFILTAINAIEERTPAPDDFLKFTPRYVKLSLDSEEESYTYNTVIEKAPESLGGVPLAELKRQFRDNKVATDTSGGTTTYIGPLEIMDSSDVDTPSFGKSFSQDTNLSPRLFSLTAFSLMLRGLNDPNKSVAGLAEVLDKTTPNTINKDVLAAALSTMSAASQTIVNANGEIEKNDFLTSQSATAFEVSTNLKFTLETNRTERMNVLSPHAIPELKSAQKHVNIQKQYTSAVSPGFILMDDYNLNISDRLPDRRSYRADELTTKMEQAVKTSNSSATQIEDSFLTPPKPVKVGYLIEKVQINSDGSRTELPEHTIRLEPHERTFYDFKVKYGVTYEYTVSTVSAIEFRVPSPTDASIHYVVAFVKSAPNVLQRVTCEEFKAPLPPGPVSIKYMPYRDSIRICWQVPTNPQKDIKYFQVFKRDSVNKPYTLIKMYDFDKTLEKKGIREYVEPFLVEQVKFIRTYHDDVLDKSKPQFYAVAAVDAHGLTSAYSAQFRVSYDPYKNDVVVDLLSREGAPKAYPNFFMKKSLTESSYTILEDVMKDSNHSSMKIYFDPEYLNVTAKNGSDIELLSTFTDHINANKSDSELLSPPGKDPKRQFYKFSIINVDRQLARTLTIGINDVRTVRTQRNQTMLNIATPSIFNIVASDFVKVPESINRFDLELSKLTTGKRLPGDAPERILKF